MERRTRYSQALKSKSPGWGFSASPDRWVSAVQGSKKEDKKEEDERMKECILWS